MILRLYSSFHVILRYKCLLTASKERIEKHLLLYALLGLVRKLLGVDVGSTKNNQDLVELWESVSEVVCLIDFWKWQQVMRILFMCLPASGHSRTYYIPSWGACVSLPLCLSTNNLLWFFEVYISTFNHL